MGLGKLNWYNESARDKDHHYIRVPLNVFPLCSPETKDSKENHKDCYTDTCANEEDRILFCDSFFCLLFNRCN